MLKFVEEKVVHDNVSSFKAVVYENKYFVRPLHSHPEYELMLVVEGEGLCFCGDYIGKLKKGDIYLFGKDLPHFFLCNKSYYVPDSKKKVKSIYFQFSEDVLPNNFKQMYGFREINHILNLSGRGLLFPSDQAPDILKAIRKVPLIKDFEKVVTLYSILGMLGKDDKLNVLASVSYQNPSNESKDTVYNKVIAYIHNNYQKEINLTEIANIAYMNKSALCRYFKKISGKTIFDYIHETRISYACKLIANSEFKISSIAYDSGFNHIPYFNHSFKAFTGYTPTNYRLLFQSKKE